MKLFAFKYSILIFAGLLVSKTRAQNLNIDSALKVLKVAKEDTNKVILLSSIAWDISYQDLQKGLEYAEQSMILAKKLNAERQYPRVFRVAGSIYHDMAEQGKALDLYLESIKYIKKYNLIREEGFVYNSLGNFYNRRNDLRKAVSYYMLCVDAHKKANNIPPVYKAYNNLSGAYLKIKKPDSALYYIHLCKTYNLENNNRESLLYNNIALSEIYTETDNKKKGLAFADSAVAIAKEISDKYSLVRALIQQAYALGGNNRMNEAVAVLEECMEIANEIGDLTSLESAATFATDYYESMGDYKNALKYYKKRKAYGDSLSSNENIRQIRMAEAKYENEKKQAEIELLDEKQKLSEARQEKNKLYLSSAGVGIIALIALIILLYRNNRNKQKANAELALYNDEVKHQKELVEDKNKEITDSINYAQRIQQSLLTSHAYFEKNTRESFILFKPKDIVSGDFYWALNHEGNFMLMTADCTGHGVPGAMMSMMGINFINEIVNEKKLSSPAAILNQLRKEIIKSLNPEGSTVEGKDGMDCSLCSFDLKNGRLTYANANNSFYILRKGTLIHSQVNKMPVGAGHNSDNLFNEFQMGLEKDDIVITLTDGYADQFGGPQGKKFKYRQLEKLLTDTAHLPLSGMRDILDKTIDDWRGSLGQVDDICIIGIKI